MKLLGKNKENSIENLSNGPGAEVGTRMFTNKYLIRLLWPLFVEQLLVFAIGIADSFMVASVGEEAVSAVSLVDSIMMLLITIMTALATGGAVVVGQYLGQKKEAEARKAGDQLLLFVTALSLIIVAVMYIFRKGLLPLVFGDVEPQVMAYCNTYFKIVVATVPLIAVYNAGAALFRSIGNSKIAMKISLLMNVINISGNAVLLYGFHCGVEGVAIPTLAARFVAALIVIKALRNPDLAVHLSRPFVWRPNWKLIKNILRIGIPNGIENSMFQLGKLLLLSMISGFGTTAIAANAVANTVAMIAVLPGMAVGYGIVSVISQCVGSGDYEQVRYYGRKLIKWVYLLMGIVDILIILLIPVIIDLYGLSEATGDLAGKIILFHNICAIVIWPISFSLPNVLRAASDVMYTMIIGVGSMWVFRILSGYLLGSVLGMGVFGVWVAMIIDWVVRSVCFLIRYHGGKWKHPAVR